ncbi:Peroxidase 7 [Morus notabilis]|uniref:peroxidase n=1 Tax=Morus notabilis TaxID=981085 RepID=W9R1D5_9ROSA|nr:Peroxidase 7 [Morus notabilis]
MSGSTDLEEITSSGVGSEEESVTITSGSSYVKRRLVASLPLLATNSLRSISTDGSLGGPRTLLATSEGERRGMNAKITSSRSHCSKTAWSSSSEQRGRGKSFLSERESLEDFSKAVRKLVDHNVLQVHPVLQNDIVHANVNKRSFVTFIITVKGEVVESLDEVQEVFSVPLSGVIKLNDHDSFLILAIFTTKISHHLKPAQERRLQFLTKQPLLEHLTYLISIEHRKNLQTYRSLSEQGRYLQSQRSLLKHGKHVLSAVNQSQNNKASAPASRKSQKKSTKPLPPEAFLSVTHYEKTCPDAEAIIQRRMRAWINQDPTLAPAIIRLHFHDCAVRGCDASVLLNHRGSERRAQASKTLRGFRVIDDIKSVLEKTCPKTVSCADILTAAARDATIFAGGPFWEVPFGRKDGRISMAKEADAVPHGRENVTGLIDFFKLRGLNMLDLVVLSGSHTIGRSSCFSLQHRLGKSPDRSLNVTYLNLLRNKCRSSPHNLVDLDVTTPKAFDTMYYTNLASKKGLLSTDQLLFSDERTSPFVSALVSQPQLFETQFAVSMVKLGNVQVKTRPIDKGEIRVNCNFVNAA